MDIMCLQMWSVDITASVVFLPKNAWCEFNYKAVIRQIEIMGHPIRLLMWTLKICQYDERQERKVKGPWQLNAMHDSSLDWKKSVLRT